MARSNAEILAAVAEQIVHVEKLNARGHLSVDEFIGRDLSLRTVLRTLGMSRNAVQTAIETARREY